MITLSQNIFLPICSWIKHSLTGTSASPSGPEIFLLHGISLGLYGNLLKDHLDTTLVDAPVSYTASTTMLLTLTLYRITMPKLTSPIRLPVLCSHLVNLSYYHCTTDYQATVLPAPWSRLILEFWRMLLHSP